MDKKWRTINILILSGLLMAGLISCSKGDQDTEYPIINMGAANAFPKDCDTITIGKSLIFRGLLSDNTELGSYSLDIHNNFDHHSHSSSIVVCPLDPIKTPVNPWVFIQDYIIPGGTDVYEAIDTIFVPTGIDPGDYHLMIRVTDHEGWQTLKGISVKLVY
jgi:hypothetical protein